MVWYQKFEYAIGHWLQKAAEHMLGCVLCSPGCFSLFRGSAIMDDNVMRTYATKSTEARHYVQYDQGKTFLLSKFKKVRTDGYVPCSFSRATRWSIVQPRMLLPMLQKHSGSSTTNDEDGSHRH